MPTFAECPRFTKNPNYRTTVYLDEVEDVLARYDKHHKVDLDPDFQRAHVWDEEKQVKFVEYLLRGGQSGKEIYFNCPGWQGDYRGPMVLVDGKQRLEACRRFMANEIKAFGHLRSEYTDPIPPSAQLNFNVNDLPTRAQVLGWYLDLNSGGVVHTPEEIQKVRELLILDKQTVEVEGPELS